MGPPCPERSSTPCGPGPAPRARASRSRPCWELPAPSGWIALNRSPDPFQLPFTSCVHGLAWPKPQVPQHTCGGGGQRSPRVRPVSMVNGARAGRFPDRDLALANWLQGAECSPPWCQPPVSRPPHVHRAPSAHWGGPRPTDRALEVRAEDRRAGGGNAIWGPRLRPPSQGLGDAGVSGFLALSIPATVPATEATPCVQSALLSGARCLLPAPPERALRSGVSS